MTTLRHLGNGTLRRWALGLALLAAGAAVAVSPVAAQSTPAAPDSVSVTRGDKTLNVSWDAVSGASSYNVNVSGDHKGSWHRAKSGVSGASTTITGVDNGGTYYVAVQSVGSGGKLSGWRNSSAAGPYTPPNTPNPPGAPGSVSISRGDGTLTVSWGAASGAASYNINLSSNGKGSWTRAKSGATGTSATLNATNSATYYAAVQAVNSGGLSGWTNSAAAGPYTPPAPPTPPTPTPAPAPDPPSTPSSVTVTRADGTLSASWDAVDGATGYHITYSSDSKQSWTAAADNHAGTSITISGVDNAKTYVVAVRAKNAGGGSGWRHSPAMGPYTPPAPPAAPTGLSVTPGNGDYAVAWDAVSGATGYDVRAKASGSSTWHDAASNVTGTSYTYTTSQTLDHIGVRARNAGGPSAWTEISRSPSNEWLTTVQQFGGASLASAQAQAQSALASPYPVLDPTTSACRSPPPPASSPAIARATSICVRTLEAQPSGCAVSEMKPRMRGATTCSDMVRPSVRRRYRTGDGRGGRDGRRATALATGPCCSAGWRRRSARAGTAPRTCHRRASAGCPRPPSRRSP